MPRIDPIQLLNCLSVLLSPNGGIKSRNEVQRLAGLMTKFSKKLVSKCIYIQILKCTETELLGSFMGSGGWLLVHMWLTESIVAKNWPLVKELLELLLLCPIDIERLKTNNCPKLVKELSKDGNHFALRALASKLVEQWLKTVKGEHVVPVQPSDIAQIILNAQEELCSDENKPEEQTENIEVAVEMKKEQNKTENYFESERSPETDLGKTVKNELEFKETEEAHNEPESLPVLKITLKDGQQVISQVNNSEIKEELSDSEKAKDRHKNKSNRDKSSDKSNSSRSSSSKYSNKSSSSSDKHKSSHRSSTDSNSSRNKSKEDKNKDKHSSHSSKSKSDNSKKSSDKSSSSSKSKNDRYTKSEKEKNKDKFKEKTSEKERSQEKSRVDKNDKSKDSPKTSNDKSDEIIQTPSINKLGKIPKLTEVKKEKPSISIEVRKPDEPKPKTVKTFNSKFRKHGLEEEVKPPPSRAAVLSKKSTPVLPPTVSIPKRPSPLRTEPPPEKKPKQTIEPIEKPGSIKLIPPKPKPMMLLESDMFMDALNASATNKKEPKKRKRRTSGSKDGNAPGDGSPPNTPTAISSPSSESKSVPPRFYQDTLETDENKEKSSVGSPEKNESMDSCKFEKDTEEPMDTSEPHTLTVNGLKGVLCYHKKKGPKKSIKWKPDSELEEIQYFELDETERVNVTKTFTDMKYLERIHEREAFQKARNLINDDVMEEKTSWRPLIPIDADGQIQVEHGKNSKEKDIQAIRQKGTLQPLYFHKAMIPDSPVEPDPETHTYSEPTIIPLDDITGNQDNVSDFRNMPWPEPKGNAPPSTSNINIPSMFPPNIAQFPNSFPNSQFPVVPGFQGPNMGPGDWPNGVPPHIIASNIGVPMAPTPLAPGAIPPGNVPPGMIIPAENMMIGPDGPMFGPPNPMFPVPPEGFNMQQNMFPMDFNMSGPQGPGPERFAGPANFRGTMRGRGAGGHWRGKSGGNWEGGPQRGRGGHSRGGRKQLCIYFQKRGSCRQGDNCSFLHPGVNCPY